MAKLLHKRNAEVGVQPDVSELSLGELAINTISGKLFTKINDGSEKIHEIGTIEDAVTSETKGVETRIARIVKITQGDYDTISVKDSDKLYIIVAEAGGD